nr:amiloride-sensitive sodium channel subunit gamma-like [Lytechinus pictus]
MDQRAKNDVYDLIKPMLENTGAHGIPNIVRAENLPRRLAWSLLFLVALGFFIGLSGNLIRKYYNFDYSVNVEVIFEPTINFPAVTVCNMNPYRQSSVVNVSLELTEILGLESGVLSSKWNSSTKVLYGDWENLEFSSLDAFTEILKSATQEVGNMSYEQRFNIGHELDDMLLSCTFHGSPCAPANFTWFFNYLYGNCYTFNSGVAGLPLRSNEIGPIYGLALELFIDQEEYISTLQPSAGIRLLIHDQNEMPFPEDSGSTLAPGRATSIGMTKISVHQLGYPYTTCTDDFRVDNIFRERFPHIIYSVPACEKNCLFNHIRNECGCADARYRFNESIPACNILPDQQNQEKECFKRATEQYINREIICDCKTPCRKSFYKETISEAVWPNDQHRPTVLEGIKQLSDHLRDRIENNTQFIDTNVVKVIVYFSSLEYENFYQTPEYTVYDLISALGGQVGLWIGVSVLTVFEFIELLYDILKYGCTKLTKLGKRTVFAGDTIERDPVEHDLHKC